MMRNWWIPMLVGAGLAMVGYGLDTWQGWGGIFLYIGGRIEGIFFYENT